MIKLDIDDAIAVHKAWRQLVEHAIIGIDADKLNDLSVADHTKCILGTWLYADEQRQFDSLTTFRNALEVHQEFHRVADQIIGKLLEGRVDEAQHLLESTFIDTSDQLVMTLQEFRQLTQNN